MTEYFKFANPYETQTVERDLFQIPAKVLSSVEQEIIDGKQDDSLAALLADSQMATKVSDRLESNIKQRFLAQPSSQRVITALHQGDRLRDAAAKALVSVEVARKVLAVMQKV